MKRSRRSQLAASLVAILLAGCGRSALQISPEAVSGCLPVKPQAIKVAWNAGREGSGPWMIQIGRAGGQDRRFWFHTTEPEGSRLTGRWGVDGMTFFLVDSDGRELARRTLEAMPCRARPPK